MSVNYAAGLSAYDNKGKLGLPEIFDSPNEIERKVHILTEWVRSSQHFVAHTGAGVSTAAGIPDFRGPKGVWTLEVEGAAPVMNVTFDEAIPTFTHMALVALERLNILKFLITQNVDGLHMRSGFPKDRMSELHGNVFIERCNTCKFDHIREKSVNCVGEKFTGNICSKKRGTGIMCRGRLIDTVLDWEAALPPEELAVAEQQCQVADLSVCLGSTLQIVPAGTLPLLTKKNGGRLVIINLQPTKQDKHADLIIHARVDDVMQLLLRNLRIQSLDYMKPVYSPHTLHRIREKPTKPEKRRVPRRKTRSKSSTSPPRRSGRRKVSKGIVPSPSAKSRQRRDSSSESPSLRRQDVATDADGTMTSSFDVTINGVVRLSFDQTANVERNDFRNDDDDDMRLSEFLPKIRERCYYGKATNSDDIWKCNNIKLPG